MFPILSINQFTVDTPERRLAHFLNAWAACDWERMVYSCVALYRKNPVIGIQQLKRFFGQRQVGQSRDGGIPIIGTEENKGVNLVAAEIILAKSKGPYAKIVASMEFVRRGDAKNKFGEVFTFEVIRELEETGEVNPSGVWFVVPKFEVYSDQLFDMDNIFGEHDPLEFAPDIPELSKSPK